MRGRIPLGLALRTVLGYVMFLFRSENTLLVATGIGVVLVVAGLIVRTLRQRDAGDRTRGCISTLESQRRPTPAWALVPVPTIPPFTL